MPSTTSSSVSKDFASSTVITPSLPTFFIASARNWPISASPFAEIVPTCAISWLDVTFLEFFCRSSTTASTARSTPRLRSIGFNTRCHRLGAFLDNGLRKNRCGSCAITCEVRGLRGNFTHHLRTHVLELVFKLDFFGDGDAVLGHARCAK